jgi:predicted DNA-binding transcriptional regulator YafY
MLILFVKILYKNWQGKIAWRNIIPQKIYYASTEWHPEPQLILLAYDADKKGYRHFAMKDIIKMEGEIKCQTIDLGF